jgi:hypothetical protein
VKISAAPVIRNPERPVIHSSPGSKRVIANEKSKKISATYPANEFVPVIERFGQDASRPEYDAIRPDVDMIELQQPCGRNDHTEFMLEQRQICIVEVLRQLPLRPDLLGKDSSRLAYNFGEWHYSFPSLTNTFAGAMLWL